MPFQIPALVSIYIDKTFRVVYNNEENHQTSIINTIVFLFFPESLAHYPTLISLRRPSIARLEAEWTPWRSALYGDDRFRFTYSVIFLLRTSKGQTEQGVLVLDLGTVWDSVYLGPQKGSVILTCLYCRGMYYINAPGKGIQDIPGSWIPCHGFRITDTGFRIIIQWNLDSGFFELYSGFQSPGLQDSWFYKPKFSGSRNLDFLQGQIIHTFYIYI